jgi:tripeptidyl-peptidase-1
MVNFSICSVLTILSFATTAVLAESPLYSQYTIKDSHHVPREWTRVGPAPAGHLIKLQIGLKQSQFGELERHLYEGM